MSARNLSELQLSRASLGSPKFLGVITTTDGNAKNNSDTAVAFKATAGDTLAGKLLLVQPSATVYFLAKELSSEAVTAAQGVKLAADQLQPILMTSTDHFLSIIRDGSTDVSLRVWELK